MSKRLHGLGNRDTRRALDKAMLCIARATKIPGRVLGKLDHSRLAEMAEKRGRKFDALGVVTILPLQLETPAIAA